MASRNGIGHAVASDNLLTSPSSVPGFPNKNHRDANRSRNSLCSLLYLRALQRYGRAPCLNRVRQGVALAAGSAGPSFVLQTFHLLKASLRSLRFHLRGSSSSMARAIALPMPSRMSCGTLSPIATSSSPS